MKIIHGKKSRNIYYYDEDNMILEDKAGNRIKLYEPLSDISDNNLRLYLDEFFSEFYKLTNGFKEICKADKINKIEWM